MFYEAIRTVLDAPVDLPAYRQRLFVGFPQQRSFGNIFSSGTTVTEGEQLTPSVLDDDIGEYPNTNGYHSDTRKPWYFLINKGK